MADVMQLFDEWAASYARGENPDPLEPLQQAGEGTDELAAMMERYLRARPRDDPPAEAVALARAWIAGAAPLVELRARQGLRRDDVVDAVMAEFALSPEKRPIVKSYYHRLEAGLLDPSRLSTTLLDLLAKTFGVAQDAILAWRTRPLKVVPAFRIPSDTDAGEVKVRASPSRELDDPEIRQIFLSGR